MIEPLVAFLVRLFPTLSDELISARLKDKPEEYLKKVLVNAVMIAIVVTFLMFVMLSGMKARDPTISYRLLFLAFPGSLVFAFLFFRNIPRVYMRREEVEINKNILFAGRYLLVKMESGEPLFLSMIGASKGYGATSRAFNDIVQDVNFGQTIEKAIARAVKYNPSRNFKRILWELLNAMQTGSNIRNSLRSLLNQIEQEHIIEIEKYGKKLNSLTLFYMVLAIIVPSLGMTMFIIIASFIKLQIPASILYFILFLLAFLQFMFIAMFRAIRPGVDV
ncbi:type II secretion system F family protein [Candidatus Woesearchaeota archaeon]|nr:type II secretion system F family protein [Candidatus Woesearchaeota archaeon]